MHYLKKLRPVSKPPRRPAQATRAAANPSATANPPSPPLHHHRCQRGPPGSSRGSLGWRRRGVLPSRLQIYLCGDGSRWSRRRYGATAMRWGWGWNGGRRRRLAAISPLLPSHLPSLPLHRRQWRPWATGRADLGLLGLDLPPPRRTLPLVGIFHGGSLVCAPRELGLRGGGRPPCPEGGSGPPRPDLLASGLGQDRALLSGLRQSGGLRATTTPSGWSCNVAGCVVRPWACRRWGCVPMFALVCKGQQRLHVVWR
jgi:hypothetical protein